MRHVFHMCMFYLFNSLHLLVKDVSHGLQIDIMEIETCLTCAPVNDRILCQSKHNMKTNGYSYIHIMHTMSHTYVKAQKENRYNTKSCSWILFTLSCSVCLHWGMLGLGFFSLSNSFAT